MERPSSKASKRGAQREEQQPEDLPEPNLEEAIQMLMDHQKK